MENIVAQQRERLLALINISLGENEDYNKSVVERVESMFSDYAKPQRLNPKAPNNLMEVREESFEKSCLLLEEKGSTRTEDLTAYQFYKRIEIIQEQNQKRNVRT